MAKKKKDAIMPWQAEMEKDALVAAAQEDGVVGGQSFSTKSGVLSFDSSPIKDNKMTVVIVDSLNTNIHYEGKYDPSNLESPDCYAFGRDDKTMKPHKDIPKPPSKSCVDCLNNEWGSADTGRGKACGNKRRLALISADKLGDVKKGYYEGNEIAFLSVPPTSIKAYAGFVKKLASTIHRPPHGVFTEIEVVPDDKDQFKITFEAVEEVPDKLMPVMMARHKEAQSVIEYPFQAKEGAPEKKPGKGKSKKGNKRKF